MKLNPLAHKSHLSRVKLPQNRVNEAQVQVIEQCKRKLQKYLKRARAANGDLAIIYRMCCRADRQVDKVRAAGLRGSSKQKVEDYVRRAQDELVALLEQGLASTEQSLDSDEHQHQWHVTIETVPDEDGLSSP